MGARRGNGERVVIGHYKAAGWMELGIASNGGII